MLPIFTKDRKNNVYLREGIRYTKGRYLVPATGQNPITTSASGYSPPVIIEGQQDSCTQIFALSGLHTSSDNADVQARLKVKLYDSTYRRDLMNDWVLANHVYGNNLRPFKLCESLLLEPQQVLQASFYNPSALGDSHFSQALETRIFQSPTFKMGDISEKLLELRARARYFYPYWLVADQAISIPANGQCDAFFTVNKNIRFIILAYLCDTITAGQSGNTQEVFLATITDPSTTRPLTNYGVTKTILTGTGQYPHWLPTAFMIEPNTKIQIHFENLITDELTEVFWTFYGIAITADGWQEKSFV